jgi:uncharacterized protein YukE
MRRLSRSSTGIELSLALVAALVLLSAGTAIAAGAPVNSSAPTISGTAMDQQTLVAYPGTWSSTTPVTYGYQWLRCDATGGNCVDIVGSIYRSKLLKSRDVGSRLRVRITATNSDGSTVATSDPTGVVQAVPPSNTSPPTISGTMQDGQKVTSGVGTWQGSTPLAYQYQWQRCDASGGNCVDIVGATASTRKLISTDVGTTVRVRVTADNSSLTGGGKATATSAATGVIQALPPTNSSPPTISGMLKEGVNLTATKGSWKGSTPRTYTYQWQRCDPLGSSCLDIVGASLSAYKLTGTDVLRTIRVRVTADNSSLPGGGVSSATSAPTGVVSPNVKGYAQQGATVTASTGSFDYQWLRCDATGGNCADVQGATAQTYKPTSADVGHALRVRVSDPTTAIASAPSIAVFPPAGAECGSLTGSPPSTYQHVIWIWFENKNYNEMIGNPSAPYFNSLASTCGLASNYYAVAHNSHRDYIAATGGEIRPPIGDESTTGYDATAPSIFGQGESWRGYMESMPGNCAPRDLNGEYYEHGHNPPLYYGALSATCPLFDIPMGDGASGRFVSDLHGAALPAFSFITPNGCNDMHRLCGASNVNGMIAHGDAWLESWLKMISATSDYQSGNTVIFVTFDEGEVTTNPSNLEEDCLATLSETCHVVTLVISPYLHGMSVNTFFSHFSLLKTAEQMLGLPLLGHAADPSTASMRPGFGL